MQKEGWNEKMKRHKTLGTKPGDEKAYRITGEEVSEENNQGTREPGRQTSKRATAGEVKNQHLHGLKRMLELKRKEL